MKPVVPSMALNPSQTRPWWLWPNVLGLDAPLVALVWKETWAMCLGVELAWIQRGLLALAVWLSYCGDRLLDARRLDGPVGSQRHEFARRHAIFLKRVWLGAVMGMVVLGLSLPWSEIAWGTVMLAGVGGILSVATLGSYAGGGGCVQGADGRWGVCRGDGVFRGRAGAILMGNADGNGGVGRVVCYELCGARLVGS